MKDFFVNLTSGVLKEDVSIHHKDILDRLISLKVIKTKNNLYKLDSSYRVGVVDISRNGTGYLSQYSKKELKDLVIDASDLLGASKGDIVLAKRVFKRGGRPKAKVIEILKKEHDFIVVYTKIVDGKVLGFNIKSDLPVVLSASQKSLKKLPVGTVFKIDNYTNIIVEVLGVLDDPKVDEKISLALYAKEENFSSLAELQAQSYGDFVDKSSYPNRVDLTHLSFCTIDPPTAKDFDDAIYFDKDRAILYVAIADVSEYVYPLSAIDKEAKQRGFSIYFPHKSIPMLPRALSENICSLKPDVDRLAFIYKITFDLDSVKIKSEELIEGVIHSKRRYSYDKIDLFLSGDFSQKDSIDDEILNYLLPLNKTLKKFRDKRLLRGCEFRSSEYSMKLDENQNLIDIKQEYETPSHALIEDAMLLANKAAAKSFEKGIYRVHDRPSFERMQELLDDLSTIGVYAEVSDDIYKTIKSLQKSADEKHLRVEVDKLIIRAQKQAEYSCENIGHFGLGFEKYTHFTSPIRRYSDLLVHRILKAIKKGDKKLLDYLLHDIGILASIISKKEREAAKVAWDFEDRKYARWAKEHLGEIVDATIVDDHNTPIAKATSGFLNGARLFLLDRDVDMFEKVKVQIIESHITSAKIIATIKSREKEDV